MSKGCVNPHIMSFISLILLSSAALPTKTYATPAWCIRRRPSYSRVCPGFYAACVKYFVALLQVTGGDKSSPKGEFSDCRWSQSLTAAAPKRRYLAGQWYVHEASALGLSRRAK